MNTVNAHTALIDINKWLDYKRIKPNKRENYTDQIEALTAAIEDGSLVLNDDYTLTLKLEVPTEGEPGISQLKFAPRLTVGQIHAQMNGVKSTDADARLIAMVAALTSMPKGVINKLDTGDYGICQNIALFFL